MDNKKAMQVFESDQKKQKIYDALTKHKQLGSFELIDATGLHPYHCKNTVKKMVFDNIIVEDKYLCNKAKRWLLRFKLSGKHFKAKTYEECLQYLSDIVNHVNKKGMYDDLINANPNLRKFHGKNSLLDTKDKDYFKSGLKSKVNRGIGSTWSMFDAATGFD
jgi:histidyl-tRNA synthetase